MHTVAHNEPLGQSERKQLRVKKLDQVNNRTRRKPLQVVKKPEKQEEPDDQPAVSLFR